MAIFRRKRGGDDAERPDDGFTPQPEKARKWFEHAKTAAMSTNHAYALELYAGGLKLDPEAMSAHEAMYESAIHYAGKGGKAASGREVKSIDDGTAVGRFAAAEFAWMKDIHNGDLACKALDAAVKAEQAEWGNWIAARALGVIRRGKKLSKSQLMTVRDLFARLGAWNEAITAGELALQLDPSDNDLAAELKDLAAQRAMDEGRYEEAGGEEGGFRKFVRGAEEQQRLQEEAAMSGVDSIDERNLLRAKRAYDESPSDPDAINRYAQLVKKTGTDEALDEAEEVYRKGFEATQEYRFRMAEGDVRIERLRRRFKALRDKLESNGESEELRARLEEARRELLELERSEFEERAAKYPTDRRIKFTLGTVQMELGEFDDAMPNFQKAKDEPKLRVRAGHYLGRCFTRVNWHGDAIAEYRDALLVVEPGDEDRELKISYDLMGSLETLAREERSLEMAREARDLCSAIARKDIGFRDIRERRRALDELVKELSATGPT